MGCSHSKFARRKRKKKSSYHESYSPEQEETQKDLQTDGEDVEKFSNQKQKYPENGSHIDLSSGKNKRSTSINTRHYDVKDLMTSIGFREDSTEDSMIMRNPVSEEFPRRKCELKFRRRKLYSVLILAMTVFVYSMRLSRNIRIRDI